MDKSCPRAAARAAVNLPQMTKNLHIYLGLGSNLANELGTPREHLTRAVHALRTLGQVRTSSLYKSAPLGPQDQPHFYNAVVELRPFNTKLQPLELLAFVQKLENEAGRKRLRHWGERSLDVDILLFGDAISNTEKLTLPHYGILERNFVALPLLELAPDALVGHTKLADAKTAQDWAGLEVAQDASWSVLNSDFKP